MQRTILFTINIILILCTVSSFAQKKIALIVAVGKYDPNQRDWKNLNAHRDLIYIREALQKNGFALNNIDTLRDAQATKAAMVKALDALAKKASKGDIVYFHFSGHGQQIQDSKTDGILDEADGYDEALIPYDAKGKWDQVDYKGEKHFRDDLLADKLLAIRKNVGEQGSVVVLIDACHSGTATRSAGIVRGDPVPLQQYNYKPNVVIDLSKNPEVGLLENMGTDMGSLVVFSGSSPNQVNRETKDDKGNNVGSLSYAFAKAITSLPTNCNYQLLFQKVKTIIQADEPAQIPMFEGNGALKVFSNQYIPLREIITADLLLNNADNGFNDTTFFISRGLFHNVHVGTTLKVYIQGSEELFTTAIVQEVNSFQSKCVATKRLAKPHNYEVKIDGLSYGSIAASYSIQNKTKVNSLEQQLANFLQPQAFLTANENPDYTIDINEANDAYEVFLIEKNDSIRFTTKVVKGDSLSVADMQLLLEDIKQGMRIRYLRKMEDGGQLASWVKAAIIPDKRKPTGGEIVLYPNDDFSLVLTSNYDGELYYTILDLLPNNQVKVLVPDTLMFAADYSIRKGQTINIPMFADSTSLTGKEFLKVIFTTQPIDLRPSFEKTTVRSFAPKPMEKMMDDLFPKDKQTQTRTGTVQLTGIGIVTTGFTLKKE
jgi:hypothetical protein